MTLDELSAEAGIRFRAATEEEIAALAISTAVEKRPNTGSVVGVNDGLLCIAYESDGRLASSVISGGVVR